jgi:hypothetical protein
MSIDLDTELLRIDARLDRIDLTHRTTQTAGGTKAVWRCTQPHGGRASRRQLGEALPLVGGGALFRSRIRWMPSDDLNLRPWVRDHLLGAGLTPEVLTDATLVSGYLDHLDQWTAGVLPHGERWLRKGPDSVIATVVLPGDPPDGVIGCWLRCDGHPDGARLLSTGEVLAPVARHAG